MKNLNLYKNSLETIKETELREDLIDRIIKELDSPCEELKDSYIYSLYYETKTHFWTFGFYVNWISIEEVNFKNLKK